jgi:PAS domain S-box-containing protein
VGQAGDETISAAGDAVITVDRTGTITSWNPAAERLFGHTETEAVGQTLVLIIPAEHRPRHVAAFHRAIDTGKLTHGGQPARIEATTASGQTLRLVFSLGLLRGPDGAATGAVAVLRPAFEPISFI